MSIVGVNLEYMKMILNPLFKFQRRQDKLVPTGDSDILLKHQHH